MATLIRPEISVKNKYYIDKHRHYELKHFCLQYPMWKQAAGLNAGVGSSLRERGSSAKLHSDPVADQVIRNLEYQDRIKMVEETAKQADEYLWKYILRAVTEELSYNYLKTRLEIPCGKDMYYDRYRRFFWLLNKARK